MKKLIVFVIAGISAVIAQAAALDWSASQIRDGWDTGANKIDGMAYLFVVGVNDVTESGIASLISGADSSSTLATSFEGKYVGTGTVAAGGVSGQSNNFTATAPASAFFVVISGDNVYQSAASTIDSFETLGYTTMAFGSQKNATNNSSAWSSVGGGGDVPEPTSGLLLLVGGALLALRRKQK